MSFFNIFKKSPTKKKILNIRKDMKIAVSEICDEKFWIEWHGAYDINPKYLVYWICVKSDNMKKKLKSAAELNSKLKEIIRRHNYPTEAQNSIIVDFESQETVDRESNGNWHQHFQ